MDGARALQRQARQSPRHRYVWAAADAGPSALGFVTSGVGLIDWPVISYYAAVETL